MCFEVSQQDSALRLLKLSGKIDDALLRFFPRDNLPRLRDFVIDLETIDTERRTNACHYVIIFMPLTSEGRGVKLRKNIQ